MKKGDIVLVKFPFTNLAETKLRPAVVLSNEKLNKCYNDLVLLAMTSQKLNNHELEVEISREDVSVGSIPQTSYVRLSKIVSLDKKLILRKVARIKKDKMTEVYNKFYNLIQ